jgi:UDP:flavonoid glycosyltransferase YjiC (YdhE family)
MSILLVTLGSSGDVLPFCELGAQLRARGHDVAIAANPHFAPLIARRGLELIPIGQAHEYRAFVDEVARQDRLRTFRTLMQYLARYLRPIHETIAHHRPARLVTNLAFSARIAEQKLGTDATTVVLSPAALGGAHSPPVLAGIFSPRYMPHWYKRGTLWAVDRLLIDPALAPTVNAFRRELGLDRVARMRQDGFESQHSFVAMFPEWFAPRQPDWPRKLVMSGFPLPDDRDENEGVVDDEIARLCDEQRPIVITAGTANRSAARFFRVAIEAAAELGRRALVLTAFAELLPSPLPPHARHARYLPLTRLLPRACALVHHGGVGTVAAALAAGIPQLILPFWHDQPDNAARIARLGVGATLPAHRFRAGTVASRLRELLASDAVAARLRELAARVHDDGLGAAIAAVERGTGATEAAS